MPEVLKQLSALIVLSYLSLNLYTELKYRICIFHKVQTAGNGVRGGKTPLGIALGSETKRSSCIKWATNHLSKGAEKDCTEKSHGTARIDAAIIPIKAGSRLIILRSVQPDMQLETFAKIGAIRTDLLREMGGESKPDRTNIWQGWLW